jgi:hypothetical protein
MLEDSQRLDALFQEYGQLKEEIRTALDVYDKVYGSLITVFAVVSGLLVAVNTPEKGMLLSLIPVTILGILGVVWYGHEVSLARLSARLEVVEYRMSSLLGQIDLFSWQSHWANFSPPGLIRWWQKGLVLLAMLPSFAIYLAAAWVSDSWWVSLSGQIIPRYLPFAIYLIVLAAAIVLHEAWYMRRLRNTLRTEVAKQKKIDINANIGHHPLPSAEPVSR